MPEAGRRGKVCKAQTTRRKAMSMKRVLHAGVKLLTLGLFSTVLLVSAADAGDTFNKIKQTKKVTVGTEAAFPPFEFIKDGKIVGYNKDILDYIIADLGVELDQVDVPWQGLFPGLLAGKFDFIASAMTMYDEPRRSPPSSAPERRKCCGSSTESLKPTASPALKSCRPPHRRKPSLPWRTTSRMPRLLCFRPS
jgi:hypothetical protein